MASGGEDLLIVMPSYKLVFVGPFTKLVQNHITITNPNDSDVFYKIKTTTPKLYWVCPNIGKLGPKESICIHIGLKPFHYESDSKHHKFLIQGTQSPEGVENFAEFWKQVDPKNVWYVKIKCVLILGAGEVVPLNENETDYIKNAKSHLNESDVISGHKRDDGETADEGVSTDCDEKTQDQETQDLDTLAEVRKLRLQLKFLEFDQNLLTNELCRLREIAKKEFGKLRPLFLVQMTTYDRIFVAFAIFTIVIMIASALMGKYLM